MPSKQYFHEQRHPLSYDENDGRDADRYICPKHQVQFTGGRTLHGNTAAIISHLVAFFGTGPDNLCNFILDDDDGDDRREGAPSNSRVPDYLRRKMSACAWLKVGDKNGEGNGWLGLPHSTILRFVMKNAREYRYGTKATKNASALQRIDRAIDRLRAILEPKPIQGQEAAAASREADAGEDGEEST